VEKSGASANDFAFLRLRGIVHQPRSAPQTSPVYLEPKVFTESRGRALLISPAIWRHSHHESFELLRFAVFP